MTLHYSVTLESKKYKKRKRVDGCAFFIVVDFEKIIDKERIL